MIKVNTVSLRHVFLQSTLTYGLNGRALVSVELPNTRLQGTQPKSDPSHHLHPQGASPSRRAGERSFALGANDAALTTVTRRSSGVRKVHKNRQGVFDSNEMKAFKTGPIYQNVSYAASRRFNDESRVLSASPIARLTNPSN